MGYYIEIIESTHINRVTIMMKDMEIFRCDIRNLLFNLPSDLDLVCMRVIKAVKEGEQLLYGDHNIPQYLSVKEGMRLNQIMKRNMMKRAQDFMNPDVEVIYEVGEIKSSESIEENNDPCANIKL